MEKADFSALDQPQILQFIFYPRKDFRTPPNSATDHIIPVEEGISLSCRFHVHHPSAPSILLFHGNGEVVSDYDNIAPLYNQPGINLFVADYRGYGASGGTPTFADMILDAHTIFKTFQSIVQKGQYRNELFVMGRSLGSISALELAFHYQEQIRGLIIESGFASIFKLLSYIGLPIELSCLNNLEISNLAKIRTTAIPTLIIHGEYDSIIPLTEAKDLYENIAAKEKELVVIPQADHNTILWLGIEQYFTTIKQFVFR